jgi:hypothetical protein
MANDSVDVRLSRCEIADRGGTAMPEYLSPGVYIEEVPTGSQPIPGVATSTASDGEQEVLERPSYFARMMLNAEDFLSEQNYHRERLRRHNRLLHGWGVVCGLAVAADPTADQPWRLRIEPGFALTTMGDEVHLRCIVHVDLAQYRAGGASPIFIAVRYAEESTHPVAPISDSTCSEPKPPRIAEAVAIGCLAALPESHRNVIDQPSLCETVTQDPTPSCPPPATEPWVVLAKGSLPPSANTRLDDSNIDVQSVRRIASATGPLQAQLVKSCCGTGERPRGSLFRWLASLFETDR